MSIQTNHETTPVSFRQRFYQWVVDHDDSWLFMALYIGLAVVLSIWISLFWLVVVVAIHFLFEWVRQRHHQQRPFTAVVEALWEVKLDIALVLFALALSLYMEVLFGLVGLQAAGRMGAVAKAGAKGGSRFAAWEQMIRGFFLTLDDVAQVGRAVLRGRSGEPTAEPMVDDTPQPLPLWGSWVGQWGKGDWVAIIGFVLCASFILGAPLLTDHTWVSVWATLADELHPYPIDPISSP